MHRDSMTGLLYSCRAGVGNSRRVGGRDFVVTHGVRRAVEETEGGHSTAWRTDPRWRVSRPPQTAPQ